MIDYFSDCACADVSICVLVERTGIERHTSQPIAAVHDVGQRDAACDRVAGDARHNHGAPVLVATANSVATTEMYSCGACVGGQTCCLHIHEKRSCHHRDNTN